MLGVKDICVGWRYILAYRRNVNPWMSLGDVTKKVCVDRKEVQRVIFKANPTFRCLGECDVRGTAVRWKRASKEYWKSQRNRRIKKCGGLHVNLK